MSLSRYTRHKGKPKKEERKKTQHHIIAQQKEKKRPKARIKIKLLKKNKTLLKGPGKIAIKHQ